MIRFTRSLGSALIVANLSIAALWFTLLHPGATESIGQAASSKAPIVTVPSASAFLIGNTLPPMMGDCVPRRTTIPVPIPDGRPVAEFSQVPAGLSQSVAATFPPCLQSTKLPSHMPRPLGSYRMLGIVRYEGASGTVFVSTVRPDAAAVNRGLYLGNSAGALPDGTRTFSLQGVGDNSAVSMLRWYDGGLVIDMVSTDVPLDQLEALAGSIVVK